VLDPSVADHYRSGYERSRLFPGGRPTLEFVRSLELLGRLLPAPPARVEISGSGFTEVEVYGVEGPGWPLQQEWADSRRHEQILFAARAVETEPSVIGFSHHFIATATRH
jgi:hypothetical protein